MRIAGLAVLLLLTPALYGLNISITGKEAGIELTPEYNRTYYGCMTFAGSAALELNGRYTTRGSFSVLAAGKAYEVNTAAGFRMKLLRNLPLYVYLSYIFNTIPDYETHSHTILPLIGFRGKYAGITLGHNFRFTVFFDEPAIFEPILAAEAYVNFYNTEKFRIGLRAANFNDLAAGNFGAYYLSLNSTLGITRWLSLRNDMEFYQTGSVGLSANFYGMAYKAGVVFKW
ncbi:hypothetical protein AGMMS49944_11170 [Spirochaetia bacterium]|nr:hypothetical protein AGMMS49944_11170 [Spirochaetia bacterium]